MFRSRGVNSCMNTPYTNMHDTNMHDTNRRGTCLRTAAGLGAMMVGVVL